MNLLLLPFFVRFSFSMKKYVLFRPPFYISIFALTILSHTEQKFSETKMFFSMENNPNFEMSLSLFDVDAQILEQNCYQYVAVYLVWIWTYKIVDKKALIFSCRSESGNKNGQKTDTVHNQPLCSSLYYIF